MKMFLIAYNEAVDEEVMQTLRANAIEGFTKWTKVLGQGKTSGPHLATHIWPKANNVLAVCIEDEKVAPLMECIRCLREDLGKEGVKAFSWQVEEAT